MPRIRCHYLNCKYLEDGYCGAASIELDPFDGCLTFTEIVEIVEGVIEDVEEEEEIEEGWDEEDFEEDDDDFWLDDEL